MIYLFSVICVLYSQVRFSEDIGEIYKVRLGFDDDIDAEQNWLLDTVKKKFNSNCFHCNADNCFSACKAEETMNGLPHVVLTCFDAWCDLVGPVKGTINVSYSCYANFCHKRSL